MKKLTSAALLSLALLLSACQKPGDSTLADTSAAETSTDSLAASSDNGSDTTSSVEDETSAQKIKALFTTLAETGNATYVSNKMKFTEYHYGDGMLHIFDASQRTSYWGYGEAKIANYGIAQFAYTNDTVGVDTSMTTIVSPNTNLAYKDYNHILNDLGESGKNITFTEASRSHTFSTTDTEFVQSLMELDGVDYYYDITVEDFTSARAYFNLSDDGKSLVNFGYTLTGYQGNASASLEMTGNSLSNIGTTAINSKVDAYLKTNPTFTPATAWDADTLAYIAEAAPGLTLPFPSGTSYAYSMPAGENSGLIFSDIGSGNRNDAYGAVLTGLGFVALDNENSDADNNLLVYTKTIREAQGLSQGKLVVYVGLQYQTATGELANIYPNGVWTVKLLSEEQFETVENVTLDAVNAELAAHKLLSNKAASILPTLTLPAGYTQIDYTNATSDFVYTMTLMAQYNQTNISFTYCYYADITVHYANENDADAAITSLSSQLLAAGYAGATSSTTGQALEGTFKSSADTAANALTVSITKNKTSDAAATYAGTISIAVVHYAITVN